MITEIKQILENYKKEKTFLKVSDFFKFAKCLIFITYKGTGKSYSAMLECVKNLKNKKEFAWVRNSDTEIKLSKVADSFTAILDAQGLGEEYKVKDNGVYKVSPGNKFEKGLLKGMFSNMTKPYNTASQNALNHCDLIVYDEFINPTFHRKNLFSDFLKLAHTLMRKNEAHIILLGNKHESNNDILAELGIEFDWENTEDQIIYRPEQDLLALYLDKWEIDGMKSSNKLVEKLSVYSPSMRQFNSGNISSNKMSSVKNWYINNIEKDFNPLFRFDMNETRYCVGQINNVENNAIYGVNNPIYIKQLDFESEYKDKKCLCYRGVDKRPDNIFIYDLDDLSTVEFLINRYAKGELFFSTAYAKEEFKRLLIFLKLLLMKEK